MHQWLSVSLIVALAASTASAQQRLTPTCRAEVVKLCAMSGDRRAIAECLMQKGLSLPASCQEELRARVANMARRELAEGGKANDAGEAREYSYGSHAKQRLDYYPTDRSSKAPLLLFIHGGGWSIGDKKFGTGTKPSFYNALGYNFASLNYRLVPDVTPAEQAIDIASAIAYLRANAAKLGISPNKIVLMGHSAGAHLAALVATDTRYLDRAAVPVAVIQGVILLDGAGYNVAAQMAYPGNRVQNMYEAAFGKNSATQAALSPVSHVAAPNSPNWLILHVSSRPDAKPQSSALGAGLKSNGASVSVVPVPNSTHSSINKDAGTNGTFTANAIAKFLAQHVTNIRN